MLNIDKLSPYFANDSVLIYQGDCSTIMPYIPDGGIKLVLTDPPYMKEFLYTYQHLANECPRLMARGASLVTIVGHYAIPDVIKAFDGKLKYRWMFCINQFEGKHARMAMGIEVLWKPCLWYVKDAYPQGRGFIKDGFIVDGKLGQNKEHHKWEQDLSWAEFFIQKLTKEGDIVLDPFLGSGTVAVACLRLKRKCIGNDISSEYCGVAAKRCAQEATK